MTCPVCGNQAEHGTNTDFGRRQQHDCIRCGPFKISGTAAAMLPSRLEIDPLAWARLSHAIRSVTSADDRLFILSTNLDDLIVQPLPRADQD